MDECFSLRRNNRSHRRNRLGDVSNQSSRAYNIINWKHFEITSLSGYKSFVTYYDMKKVWDLESKKFYEMLPEAQFFLLA